MVAKKVKTKVLTNPHGANQYRLDPRQSLFLAYWLDPESQSFSNATKSAVLAGYEQTYAENILDKMPAWLLAKVGEHKSSRMLEKAERNIEEMLELPSRVQAMGPFGPLYEKVPVGKKQRGKKQQFRKKAIMTYSGGLLRLKAEASTFVAKTVGRAVYGADADDTPKPSSIVNMTQIIINPPVKNA